MKENSESHPESIQRSEPYAAGPGAEAARAASATNANGASTHSAGGAMPKVDFWTALEILAHRWDWLVLGAVLSGAAFFYLAWLVIQPKFTATAQLLRYETPGASDFFRNSQMSPETFTGLIRSPDLMQEVGSNAVPPISAEKLTKLIKIEPQPDSDLVKVSYKARDAKAAVDLLNNFVNKAVKFTLDMQRSQAMRVEQDYLTEQVSNMNSDISSLQQQFTKMGVPGVLTSKLAQVSTNLNALGTHLASPQVSSVVTAQLRQRLEKSLAEYNDLLLKYTDLHPFVQAKKEEIAEIEKQLASAATNTFINSPIASAALLTSGTGPGGALANNNPEADVLRMRLLSLFEGQVQLLNKQREAQLYVKEPPGIARVFAPASLKTVQGNMRWVKISAVTIVGSGFGMVMSLGLVLLVEFTDKRLHNSEDVTRVTKLPVLTTLGDLGKMNDAERAQWAFRAW
ncbi:MAG TPA: hypothetical protein VHH88_13960, partial [Verrucomicrobiae bacterium]|nr:hypothetical protein [Verrucomicrobiae bacterium]